MGISAAKSLTGTEVEVPRSPGNVFSGGGEKELLDARTVMASDSSLSGNLLATVMLVASYAACECRST